MWPMRRDDSKPTGPISIVACDDWGFRSATSDRAVVPSDARDLLLPDNLLVGVHMRRFFLTLLLATLPVAVSAQATPAAQPQLLPRDVRREIVDRWNNAAPTALRAMDRVQIDTGREVRGDVIV